MKSDRGQKAVGKLGVVAHRVVDVIDYQAGAIVSREVVKGKTGTVTVFAFDEGQGVSEHTAPFDALAHVLDGEAEITISGKAHTVRAGEMIIMPANKPHALKAVSRFKMMLVMIRS
jgi:quercetin dioxygenase-like cupin family protein